MLELATYSSSPFAFSLTKETKDEVLSPRRDSSLSFITKSPMIIPQLKH
jgi:hypothetical protein